MILELGAGMGPVTRMIADMMHADSRLISIEVDADLRDVAAVRVPQAEVVLGSAGDLDAILDEHGIDEVDCCVSCLPVPSLPRNVNRCVLDCWRRRCTSEVFTQITQIPWWYRPMYRRAFHDVRFELVALNIPPAGVYHCRNLREDFETQERLPGKTT